MVTISFPTGVVRCNVWQCVAVCGGVWCIVSGMCPSNTVIYIYICIYIYIYILSKISRTKGGDTHYQLLIKTLLAQNLFLRALYVSMIGALKHFLA